MAYTIRYYALLALIWLIRILPYRVALSIGRGLGLLLWAVDPLHRKIATIQMKVALGDQFRKRDVIKVFMNHGDIAIDTIKYAYMSLKEIKEKVFIEGIENLEAARATGRGIMAITGHIGNWEMLTHCARILNIEFCVMADMRKDPKLESIVDDVRSRSGATILPPTGRALMLIRELKRGRLIGFVVDQIGKGNDKIFCNFFGLPAPTNPAPAFLALKGNAILLPVYAVKHADYYRICVGEMVDTRNFGNGVLAIQKLSDYMQSWIESVVRQYPSQWFWLHGRWIRRSEMRKIIKTRTDLKTYVGAQAKEALKNFNA